jgi:hypothetical protein
MDFIRTATRIVTETANATTAAAGAVGGAAITGVVGGVQGTAAGIRNGLREGSHSTPAALVTLGAVGAAGLVEWPVLVTVGGAALLVRQLSRRDDVAAVSANTSSKPKPSPRRKAPAKSTGRTSRSTRSARR